MGHSSRQSHSLKHDVPAVKALTSSLCQLAVSSPMQEPTGETATLQQHSLKLKAAARMLQHSVPLDSEVKHAKRDQSLTAAAAAGSGQEPSSQAPGTRPRFRLRSSKSTGSRTAVRSVPNHQLTAQGDTPFRQHSSINVHKQEPGIDSSMQWGQPARHRAAAAASSAAPAPVGDSLDSQQDSSAFEQAKHLLCSMLALLGKDTARRSSKRQLEPVSRMPPSSSADQAPQRPAGSAAAAAAGAHATNTAYMEDDVARRRSCHGKLLPAGPLHKELYGCSVANAQSVICNDSDPTLKAR